MIKCLDFSLFNNSIFLGVCCLSRRNVHFILASEKTNLILHSSMLKKFWEFIMYILLTSLRNYSTSYSMSLKIIITYKSNLCSTLGQLHLHKCLKKYYSSEADFYSVIVHLWLPSRCTCIINGFRCYYCLSLSELPKRSKPPRPIPFCIADHNESRC